MIDTQNQNEALLNGVPRPPELEPAITSADLALVQRHLEQQRDDVLAGIARLHAQSTDTLARRAPSAHVNAPEHIDPLAILRGELEKTLQALERLERGAYGTCLECGRPIAPRRLAVIPTAERCDACARCATAGPAAH
jgi:RNA polymerase-binding transcription factor DksA